MRVISGAARGHKLYAPEGNNTRPTTDRIKESLFNILAPDLQGCMFLDLFSGSGAIGIEALSRGSECAVFVDSESGKLIEKNLLKTRLDNKARIYSRDVIDTITMLGKNNEKFDIIFMDPPYEGGYVLPVLLAIVKAQILKKGGYIVVEGGSQCPFPSVSGLKIIREKDYKTTIMTFLILEE